MGRPCALQVGVGLLVAVGLGALLVGVGLGALLVAVGLGTLDVSPVLGTGAGTLDVVVVVGVGLVGWAALAACPLMYACMTSCQSDLLLSTSVWLA